MRLPTASQLDLAHTCPGSATLPRVAEITDGMTAGTVRHRFFQRCLEADRNTAILEIEDPTLRAMCEALDTDRLPLDPKSFAAEVALAWNWRTGAARELGRGLERDYSDRGEDEIVGTADTVGLLGGDGVYVSDFKSRFDQVAPARRNLQLRFYALAAARAYGRDRAVIEICRPTDGDPWIDRAELDAFDLAEVAEELRDLVRRIQRSAADMPVLVAGNHCRRCASIRFCPAQTAIVREVAGEPTDALIARWESELDAETACEAWHKLKAIEAFIEKAWAALEGFAMQRPIRLDEERVYGPTQVRRESIVGSVAWKVIEEAFGAEVAWSAAEVKVTKAAIERLVRERLQPGQKVTHAVRDLLDKIDRAGGLRAKVQDEIRVHKARAAREET